MIKEPEDIQKQIQNLKEVFGDALIIDPTMDELQKWFKKDYVSPFKKGIKAYVDLKVFFKYDKSIDWKKLFDNNPWQPIMITYKRQDVIFFKWLNYPKYKEEYFMEESTNSAWKKSVYPAIIKYSDIFKKKIQRLKNKNPRELEVQMGILSINDMNGQIEIIKDV